MVDNGEFFKLVSGCVVAILGFFCFRLISTYDKKFEKVDEDIDSLWRNYGKIKDSLAGQDTRVTVLEKTHE